MQNETRFIHQPPQAMQPTKLLAGEFNHLRQCRHGWMLFNVNDLFVGRSLELYGEYSEAETEVFGSSSRKGTSFSMSAPIWGRTRCALPTTVGRRGAVLAFEPQRLMFQALCANMAPEQSHQRILPQCSRRRRENGTIIVPPLDAHTVAKLR